MLGPLLLGMTLGLFSAPHCLAMCGPLAAFASLGPDGGTTLAAAARYQAGRVVGYGTVGAVAGASGHALTRLLPVSAEAVLSIALALALGVAALRLWPRTARTLVSLGRGPRRASVWERASRGVALLGARLPRSPLLLGTASALLPCGALASAVVLAAGTGSAAFGLASMVGFAGASGTGLALGSWAIGRADLTAHRGLARAFSVLLAIGAVVLALRPFLVSDGASCHAG